MTTDWGHDQDQDAAYPIGIKQAFAVRARANRHLSLNYSLRTSELTQTLHATMDTFPTQLERDGSSKLVITWSDQSRREYTAAGLRQSCPCATCREKHKSDAVEGSHATPALLPVLSIEEAQPVTIRSMRPVGNYAYNIAFSDGHDSGIYTFDHLQRLGKPSE